MGKKRIKHLGKRKRRYKSLSYFIKKICNRIYNKPFFHNTNILYFCKSTKLINIINTNLNELLKF